MRWFKLLLCALVLAWPLAASAATKKKSKIKEPEEISLSELLGKDLAKAVEESFAAYDDAETALQRHSQRKRSSNNAVLRQLAEVRDAYEKALGRAREARVEAEDSLTRDQVVVSISQSIRALDLITKGLRDDDEDQVDAGVELAGLAQADLTSIAEGGGAAGPADSGSGPEIGPSMGFNVGLSAQSNSSNVNMDLNFSVPVSDAADIGLGGSMNFSSTDSGGSPSGNLNLGGNVFGRYHFLQAFAKNPNWVPYVGAKVGYNMGTSYQGTGLNFSTTDTLGAELSGQVGLLVFMDRKSAITLEAEFGSSSSSSTPLSGPTSTSSSSSTGLTVGLRRMF